MTLPLQEISLAMPIGIGMVGCCLHAELIRTAR